MKLFIPQLNRRVKGGGWSFSSNFSKYAKDWAEFVDDPMKCDCYVIPGATMVVDKYEPERAKEKGAKIVLRVDNAPKNSNNRNSGISKLLKFSRLADLVVYQSQWAKDYLMPFVGKDGPVIMNGVDTEIFKPEGLEYPKPEGKNIYLYSRSSRDDQKGWHRAWYQYQFIQREDPNAVLWIVGKFSLENLKTNFDFFMGEQYQFFSVVTDPEQMAMMYRTAYRLLIPFFEDCCSNTLIESLACGTEPYPDDNLKTGGMPEIMKLKDLSAKRMAEEYKQEMGKLCPAI